MSTKKIYVEVLVPSILECDFIWKKGLYRGNQNKVRSEGWALIQYDLCPCKKEKYGYKDRLAWKEDNVKKHRKKKYHVKVKDWSDASTSQGSPGCQQTTKS